MNGRQAARMASQRIAELEFVNRMQAKDIKDYNQCIRDMIAGKSPCAWCEENRLNECEHENSHGSVGCKEWWLRFDKGEPEGGESDGETREEEATNDTV